MQKLLIISTLLSLLCVSAGCTYWYQEGKSFESCQDDLQQCYDYLKTRADMNSLEFYEVDFMKHCMKEKGYRLVTEDKLPRDVKRRDPQIKTFWLLAGQSGTLEE